MVGLHGVMDVAMESTGVYWRPVECGLLKGSFVPPPGIRDLRDLTRLRKTLVEDRTAQVNRVGKIRSWRTSSWPRWCRTSWG